MTAPFANWIPYKLILQDNGYYCKWFYSSSHPFNAPFFDQTIAQCLSHPYNSQSYSVITQLDHLPLAAQQLESIAPTAFIFHTSRCGSTLLCQLLSLFPENIITPEVPLFDRLLRLRFQAQSLPLTKLKDALSAAVALHGQIRFPQQQKFFVKLDSWHLPQAAFWRQLFPQVPFIFLYREPTAILRSQECRKGMQVVKGLIEPDCLGLSNKDLQAIAPNDYWPLVLNRFYQTIQQHYDPSRGDLLLEYELGAQTQVDRVIEQFDLSINDALKKAIHDRLSYHSKYPNQVFSPEALTRSRNGQLPKLQAAYDLLSVMKNDDFLKPINK